MSDNSGGEKPLHHLRHHQEMGRGGRRDLNLRIIAYYIGGLRDAEKKTMLKDIISKSGDSAFVFEGHEQIFVDELLREANLQLVEDSLVPSPERKSDSPAYLHSRGEPVTGRDWLTTAIWPNRNAEKVLVRDNQVHCWEKKKQRNIQKCLETVFCQLLMHRGSILALVED